MNTFFILFFTLLMILIYKYFCSKKSVNKKLHKFKNKFLSKEFNIKKIYLREEEKTFLNPNISINIGIYESENDIKRKLNIHRARLSKFKKSKLNEEMIFVDNDQKIFKLSNGKKKYL